MSSVHAKTFFVTHEIWSIKLRTVTLSAITGFQSFSGRVVKMSQTHRVVYSWRQRLQEKKLLRSTLWDKTGWDWKTVESEVKTRGRSSADNSRQLWPWPLTFSGSQSRTATTSLLTLLFSFIHSLFEKQSSRGLFLHYLHRPNYSSGCTRCDRLMWWLPPPIHFCDKWKIHVKHDWII